jgi:hypothetical protein
MASRAPRGDYLFVSTREVDRLAADSGTPPAVAEVENALRDHHHVKQVTDADVAVGDWFESSGLQMAYGVQSARRSEDSDSAVFVGQIDEHSAGAESSLLLSGSADFLQDQRSIRVQDVTADMSYPSALFALLASLSAGETDPSVGSEVELPTGDRRAPAHRQPTARGELAREEQWLAVGYPIAQAQSSFGRQGLFPLSFLARAVKVVHFESQGLSGRWIVGTPLWVARQLPE